MNEKEKTVELLRHLLGSIDLSDIKEEQLTEAEQKDYSAAIFAVFPRLQKDIRKFLHEQLMFSANQATDWEQVVFGRGSFNGISLLFEHWKKAADEHVANIKGEAEPFNKNHPVGEI